MLVGVILLVFGYSVGDLLYAAITKANGVYAHHKRGNVNWKIVYILASGSIPISLGLHAFYLDASFQNSSDFEQLLTKYFRYHIDTKGLYKEKISRGKTSILYDPTTQTSLYNHMADGYIAWFLCDPILSRGWCVRRCDTFDNISQTSVVKVIGTDIAHAVPLTLIAGLGYFVAGFVDILLLIGLLIGSLPAIYFGSKISSQVPDKLLQHILAVILFSLGVVYSI